MRFVLGIFAALVAASNAQAQTTVELRQTTNVEFSVPSPAERFWQFREFRLGQTLDEVRYVIANKYAGKRTADITKYLDASRNASGLSAQARTSNFVQLVRIVDVGNPPVFGDIIELSFTSPATGSRLYHIAFENRHDTVNTAPLLADFANAVQQRYGVSLQRLGHPSTRTFSAAFLGQGTATQGCELGSRYEFKADARIVAGRLESANGRPLCEFSFSVHTIISEDRAQRSMVTIFSPRLMLEGLTADWALLDQQLDADLQRQRSASPPPVTPRL